MVLCCGVAGEGALLGLTTHASSAVVSTAHLSALKLQMTDLQQLMHPADLQVRQGGWLKPPPQLLVLEFALQQPQQQAESEYGVCSCLTCSWPWWQAVQPSLPKADLYNVTATVASHQGGMCH